MSKPPSDEPPDTGPVSNALNQELGRALDREEARRLEERILTDEELRSAAARTTLIPSSEREAASARADAWVSANSGASAGPGRNLFGGTVRGLPGAPQKLHAEGSAPSAWDAPAAAPPEERPAGSDADASMSEREEPAKEAAPAKAANRLRSARAVATPFVEKPQTRRFLYLAAVLVVVPVTILLVARAIDPQPVFSAKPSAAARTASSRPNPPVASTPSETLPTPAPLEFALPPLGATSPVQTSAPTAAPQLSLPTNPRTPARVPQPEKVTPLAPTVLGPTAVTTPIQPSTTGVEPFFKRTQP